MDNDAATDTQICIPTPGETKVAVNAAIEKGATEGARLALEKAKRATSEAAAAIARLTDRVQVVTKEHVRLGLNHG